MDCSPPGSSVHGIFQARVLEWGAIAFSRKKKAFSNDVQGGIFKVHMGEQLNDLNSLLYFRSFKGNSRIALPESPSWKEGGRLGARRKGRKGGMEALGNPFTFMSQLDLKV